jgi:hypothetical protein
MLELRDRLLDVLGKQQEKRKRYDGLEWIEAERDVMLDAVNRERIAAHLEPVTMADIQRVETWACGHSDYSSKFALYCAEIALGVKEQQP